MRGGLRRASIGSPPWWRSWRPPQRNVSPVECAAVGRRAPLGGPRTLRQGVPAHREALIAEVPVCVALQRNGMRARGPDGNTFIGMALAQPPGTVLDEAARAAVRWLDTAWKDAESPYEAVQLARRRLAFGTDGGEALRKACWARHNSKWQLMEDVAAASGSGQSELSHEVEELCGEAIDAWLAPAVRTRGRNSWRCAPLRRWRLLTRSFVAKQPRPSNLPSW